MAMVVKNNMSAVSTLNTLNKNSSALQKSLQKVSSGMKINSAQDDASGYAISEKMRVQIRSLDQANQNTQNASSMMKTAEGAVSSTVEILKSLKEKAINAATDTNTDQDRATIQKELDQFIDQIDDNALTTFNGKYLVDGSKSQLGKATHTAMTNQSLATDTSGSSKLVDMQNRNNESLEIESTDYVTASFVKNGKTYTTKFLVADTTLDQVFGKMNDQYDTEQAEAGGYDSVDDMKAKNKDYKTAFAGNAVDSSSGGDDVSGTAYADAAAVNALGEAKLLTFANGTADITDPDTLQMAANLKATQGTTAATELDTAVDTKLKAVTDKYNTGNLSGGSLNPVVYQDENGDAQTALAATGALLTADNVATVATAVGSAMVKAGQVAAATATDASDVKAAMATVLDSVKINNTAISGATSTDADAELDALASAIIAQQAVANASTGTTTQQASDLKAVDGTAITKENADNYIMSSSDVDALAADYGVTRSTNDTDESYAAKVLQAVIDEGQDTDATKTKADRTGAANDVEYMKDGQTKDTLNNLSDPNKGGFTVAGSGYFFDPEEVVKVDSDNTVTVSAEKLQEGYDAYVADNALSGGTGDAIAEPYAKAAQLANHIAGLQAKNATADGIVNTIAYGTSTGTSTFKTGTYDDAKGDATAGVTTTKGLVGVDSAGDAVYTADGTEGLTITANSSGVNGQISGVTLSISDSQGNVKKSANAALDNFKTTIYAKNKSDSNELSFQVGGAANQSIAVGLDDMRSEALGLKGSDGSKVSVATQDKANAAVAVFDNAIQKALDQQTTIGAVEARLDYTSQNLTTSSENVQAAESTIRDADMAKEMTNYTKNNVLLQAAQSMLAQANQSSSQVLSLLQ